MDTAVDARVCSPRGSRARSCRKRSAPSACPTGVGTMAEWMSRQGYVTAGFFANSDLHAGNGFDRGFDTFYTPPPVTPSMHLHAEEVNRRALPWLRRTRPSRSSSTCTTSIPTIRTTTARSWTVAHRSIPSIAAASPASGSMASTPARIQLRDVADDLRHLTALYDSEIHYVDARIGELLAAIDPRGARRYSGGPDCRPRRGAPRSRRLEARTYPLRRADPRAPRSCAGMATCRRTGGWRDRYGCWTCCRRWPRRWAAQRHPAWQGEDLFAALSGEQPLPRLPVFAQHLNHGPLRAAAIVDGKKLMLFNDRMPFVPADGLQAICGATISSACGGANFSTSSAIPRELVDLAAQVESVPAVASAPASDPPPARPAAAGPARHGHRAAPRHAAGRHDPIGIARRRAGSRISWARTTALRAAVRRRRSR